MPQTSQKRVEYYINKESSLELNTCLLSQQTSDERKLNLKIKHNHIIEGIFKNTDAYLLESQIMLTSAQSH